MEQAAVTDEDGRERVAETYMLHDQTRIGPTVPEKWPGCYANFAEMADAEYVPFLNVRQVSETSGAVTNITTKSKIAWPFAVENLGIAWIFPTPYNAGLANNYEAAAKAFKEILPDHSFLQFQINEDVRLTIKPSMTTPGYGPYGAAAYTSWTNHGYADTITSGVPSLGNRWTWIGQALKIPNNNTVAARLYFDEYGKMILRRLELPPLDFKEGDDWEGQPTTPNQAAIELTLGGQRYVMKRSEYFPS